MESYNVIIIDDERLAIDVIAQYISMFPKLKVVGQFQSPSEAFSFLNNNEVDLVFTDIAMPNISGLELVKMYKGNAQFVMTTSYTQYAVESFELNVVDYLLKPISLDRFSKTIYRFEEGYRISFDTQASFFVKDGDEFVKVIIDKIDYIEGMKDYAKIYSGNNFHMVLKTLKYFEQFLEDSQFIRVHKSYIIPLNKILQFDGRYVIIDENRIPVGPSYRTKLKDYLNQRKI